MKVKIAIIKDEMTVLEKVLECLNAAKFNLDLYQNPNIEFVSTRMKAAQDKAALSQAEAQVSRAIMYVQDDSAKIDSELAKITKKIREAK